MEFTVIFLGVFVALAAETWWSEREERRELRALLSHLLALHGYVLNNQRELQAAAADILTFLRDEH